MDSNKTGYLLDKIVKGDENALRQLFEMYSHKLFHLAYYYLHTRELAEESVLDVFTAIWKKRQTLGHIKNIEYYLYTSVKNQALQYIRHNNIPDEAQLSLYEIEFIPEKDNPESTLLDKEYELLIQEAIDSLPPKCKEVFRLVLSGKLKNREIAELLSISESTVNEHIALAYKRIAGYVRKCYNK
ncbi:MAG: RNA polymerase sigma-70 factor [Tannerella sp.]|jgi:RNA polymerase sigma-70 factor (ECF subfamily)|nr:RNA polymerase sigma-70 factor [Tannerella sp.]